MKGIITGNKSGTDGSLSEANTVGHPWALTGSAVWSLLRHTLPVQWPWNSCSILTKGLGRNEEGDGGDDEENVHNFNRIQFPGTTSRTTTFSMTTSPGPAHSAPKRRSCPCTHSTQQAFSTLNQAILHRYEQNLRSNSVAPLNSPRHVNSPH
ncbi:hypothetical protein EI94DRAFT_1112558 [Lactarius quietus]|nr:hypothetical protein EI94DRAFT_1112558 [Lactarius quietus]